MSTLRLRQMLSTGIMPVSNLGVVIKSMLVTLHIKVNTHIVDENLKK